MFIIIALLLCVLCALFLPPLLNKATARESTAANGQRVNTVSKTVQLVGWSLRGVFGVLAVSLLLGTSFVTVGDDEIAQMKRVYMGSDLPPGKIIGMGEQKGKKAETFGPGFQFSLGLNVLNDVELVKHVVVAPGHYRTLSAADGKTLPPGVTYAPGFQDELSKYLDTKTFLTTEDPNIGFKGPQTTIIIPGTWRVNTYQWTVSDDIKATTIQQGFVGVVKSNTTTAVNFGPDMTSAFPTDCNAVAPPAGRSADALSSPLMPVGCVGIWDKVLHPSQYYLNTDVFVVTPIDTRVQAWPYAGGYLSRTVDLSVDAEGEITQTASSVQVEVPKNAADSAIGIKINGYTIHQSVRVLVQIEPKNAPFIVASVGTMAEVEDRIITPVVQSAIRDLSGQVILVDEAVIDSETGKPAIDSSGNAVIRQVRRPVAPLDLIERRNVLQDAAEAIIKPEGDKAGVTIREVRFLQPDMPPEVLIPRKRQQLAFAMIETLKKEQEAQIERIAKANAQATAEQQPALVKAEQAVKIAEQYKQQQLLRGEADRNYLEQVAAGQEAQKKVLGGELVAKLKMMELILENPEALAQLGKTVPNIVVMSGSGGGGGAGLGGIGSLEGFAAVLSGSGVLQTPASKPSGATGVAAK
jgi:regulator of protease activity HflC (stomatin/prohibitin superfamily)